MTGVVFRETLRRNWKGLLLLVASLGFFAFYTTLVLGDSEMLKQYSQLISTMGWAVQAFGGGDAAFMATPAGIVNFALFSWTILLLTGYAVFAGLNVTAAEEDRGVMDMLLSTPTPRWRVVVEKLLAHSVVIVVAILIGFVISVVAVSLSPTFSDPKENITAGRLLQSSLNMIPSSLLVLAFTAFAAALLRSRSTAAVVAGSFVVVSYFVDMLARTAQSGEAFRAFSFFRYYDSASVMQYGLSWPNVLGLLAVTVLLSLGALFAFERRDLNV